MKHALTLLLLLVFSACTMPRRSVRNIGEMPQADLLLVGRISLDHKLPGPARGTIDVMDTARSAWIRAGESPLPFLEVQPTSAQKDDMLVKWGELFRVPFPRYARIFIAGVYGFHSDAHLQQTLAFPVMGSIHAQAHPHARALYIGHIQLHVDDFYTLRSVRVVDEWDQDAKALRQVPGIEKSLFVTN